MGTLLFACWVIFHAFSSSKSTFSNFVSRIHVQSEFLRVWIQIRFDVLFLCSAGQNNLCNFGRGRYEEHFCDITLNLDQWFRRRCCLKDNFSSILNTLLGHTLKHFHSTIPGFSIKMTPKKLISGSSTQLEKQEISRKFPQK